MWQTLGMSNPLQLDSNMGSDGDIIYCVASALIPQVVHQVTL